MEREEIKAMYEKYNLEPKDVFKHQHYIIITRSGIEKIQAIEDIKIYYEVVRCEPDFSAVKAFAKKGEELIETFGSALKGASHKDGNCNTWYVLEMAEKRAMSRAVLKITGLYEMGVFSQDESEEFKRS